MKHFSAGEIVKKLHGVTTRQILDLAEKGFIIPVRETTGAGSARLYDFQNIFEICICLAIRGRIPARTSTQEELLGNILKVIRDNSAGSKEQVASFSADSLLRKTLSTKTKEIASLRYEPYFDLLLITYDNKDDYSFLEIQNSDTFETALKRSKKYRPQNYCTYIIEVSALWSYLNGIF